MKMADSEDTDYEGQTHVTRALKEYYEERGGLPEWLIDEEPSAKAAGKGDKASRRKSVAKGFGERRRNDDREYDDLLPRINKPTYQDDEFSQMKQPPKFKSLGSKLKKPPPSGGKINASEEFEGEKKQFGKGRFGPKN